MKLKSSEAAFSMVEVVVSSLVLATSAVAVFAVVAGSKAPQYQTDRKLIGVSRARAVSDQLRMNVAQNLWSSAQWTPGTHVLAADAAYPGVAARYTVTDLPGGAKQVTLNVSW